MEFLRGVVEQGIEGEGGGGRQLLEGWMVGMLVRDIVGSLFFGLYTKAFTDMVIDNPQPRVLNIIQHSQDLVRDIQHHAPAVCGIDIAP